MCYFTLLILSLTELLFWRKKLNKPPWDQDKEKKRAADKGKNAEEDDKEAEFYQDE